MQASGPSEPVCFLCNYVCLLLQKRSERRRYVGGHSRVLIKLYLQNQVPCWVWPQLSDPGPRVLPGMKTTATSLFVERTNACGSFAGRCVSSVQDETWRILGGQVRTASEADLCSHLYLIYRLISLSCTFCLCLQSSKVFHVSETSVSHILSLQLTNVSSLPSPFLPLSLFYVIPSYSLKVISNELVKEAFLSLHN